MPHGWGAEWLYVSWLTDSCSRPGIDNGLLASGFDEKMVIAEDRELGSLSLLKMAVNEILKPTFRNKERVNFGILDFYKSFQNRNLD
jgi:hypothetical protein